MKLHFDTINSLYFGAIVIQYIYIQYFFPQIVVFILRCGVMLDSNQPALKS